MTFNIRYGAADDGADSWPHRKDLVVETIELFRPDLFGVQEALDFQVEFLREHLPEFSAHGRGRDADGSGEQSALFFRTERFELLDSGHFWLSETPDEPGSQGWDAAFPRMCSWVKLADRQAGGATLLFLNTHWDHRGAIARLESARVLRKFLAGFHPEGAVIVSGDFNTDEDGAPYAELVLAERDGKRQLFDSYREAHPEISPNELTFNGFEGGRVGKRIDWILHSSSFSTLRAEINHISENGRFPSDHYPVEAVLRWNAAAR